MALRKRLLQNGYPKGTINFNINDVLSKNRNKIVVSTVPKKDLFIEVVHNRFFGYGIWLILWTRFGI